MFLANDELLIKRRINYLYELINSVYEKSLKQGIELKKELDSIVELASRLSQVGKDQMILESNSEEVLEKLEDIESKVTKILGISFDNYKQSYNINKVDKMLELIEDEPIKSLNDIVFYFKNCYPDKMQILSFSKKLTNKLLEFLDKGKISVKNISEFTEYLNLNAVKNEMIDYKLERVSEEELQNFINEIKNYTKEEHLMKLFYAFKGENKIIRYDFQKLKIDYPLSFEVNKDFIYSIAKTIYDEYEAEVYTENIINQYLKEQKHYDHIFFTKSNGILLADDDLFHCIVKDDTFLDDIVGLVNIGPIYNKLSDFKFPNVKFLYYLDNLKIYIETIKEMVPIKKKQEKKLFSKNKNSEEEPEYEQIITDKYFIDEFKYKYTDKIDSYFTYPDNSNKIYSENHKIGIVPGKTDFTNFQRNIKKIVLDSFPNLEFLGVNIMNEQLFPETIEIETLKVILYNPDFEIYINGNLKKFKNKEYYEELNPQIKGDCLLLTNKIYNKIKETSETINNSDNFEKVYRLSTQC